MKKNLLFILGLLCALPVFAGRTFTYDYEGQTIKYEVIDEDSKTCMVASGDVGSSKPSHDISGDLILPSHPEDENGEKYTLTRIGFYSFYKNKLTSVSIPETVTYIGGSAFGRCDLEYVNFASVESILNMWYYTYENKVTMSESQVIACSKKLYIDGKEITELVIPDGVTEIGGYDQEYYRRFAFYGAHGITSVKLPESLTKIDAYTFCGINIDGLIIPESVESIGKEAFKSCTNLFDVMLLPKECEIDNTAFADCLRLIKVAAYNPDFFDAFSDGISLWTIDEGETVDAEKGIIWAAPSNPNPYPWVSTKYSGKLEIPEGVTSLPWPCMATCTNITEVILPESLETIGEQAFYQCSGLDEILIPTKVTNIGNKVFNYTNIKKAGYPDAISNPFGEDVLAIKYDAYNAKIENGCVYSRRNDMLYYVPMNVGPEFTVPEGVTEITDEAFAMCNNLVNLTLPNTLTSLGERVWDGCNTLNVIYCHATEPIAAKRDLFPVDVYDSATLHVPAESVSAYEKTAPWSYFYDIKSLIDSGVETVPAMEEVAVNFTLPYVVFNLNGVKVAESTVNLPAGLYIVRQGNAVKKIAVK